MEDWGVGLRTYKLANFLLSGTIRESRLSASVDSIFLISTAERSFELSRKE